MTNKLNIIFGPVASRRLGVSLGIDLLPKKTCSLNCVYCEAGRTTKLTVQREEYYPIGDVLTELDRVLSPNPELDYITFAGSGEPMLYLHFGKIVEHLKNNYPQYKTCLLTNGTLFYDQQVRAEMMDVDMVVPSVDAGTDFAFRKINRNIPSNTLEQIVTGLIQFSKEYKGELQLEVFIVPGVNDSEVEIQAIVDIAKKINPILVQLNSLDRPGTESWPEQATPSSLQAIAKEFSPLEVSIVSKFKGKRGSYSQVEFKKLVIDTISRRPATAEDFSDITGLPLGEITQVLTSLVDAKKIYPVMQKRGVFYKVR